MGRVGIEPTTLGLSQSLRGSFMALSIHSSCHGVCRDYLEACADASPR